MGTLLDAIECFIPGDWGNEFLSEDTPNKVVCIRGADIDNVKGGIFGAIPQRYVSNQSYKGKTLNIGDIVIEKSGGSPTQSTGRVCYISEDLKAEKSNIVCSNFCAAFRLTDKWFYKYVYYYLQNVYNQGNFFNFEGKTSGIRNLLLETAFKSISLPDINIKKQIEYVSIIDEIDKKIILNTRMNAELEAMAKQLYDYWFVQFDFPDENGNPYKSSGGKMVYNSTLKRAIPAGWEVKNLFYIANYYNGLACQNYRPTEGETSLPVIKITEMHNGFTSETERASSNIPPEAIIENGNVLFAWSASLEVMLWGLGKGALNQHIFKVTSNNGFPKSFYYYQLLEYVGHFKKIAEAKKTTMGHITKDHLEQSQIVVPPTTDLPNQLEEKLEPIMDKIVSLSSERIYLTHLRDSLLPMLMNGQVTVE